MDSRCAAARAGRLVLAKTVAKRVRKSSTCRSLTIKGGSKRSTWSCVQLMISPCCSARSHVGLPLDGKIESEHQAFAAHFADEIEFRSPAGKDRRAVARRAARTFSSKSSSSIVARNSSATAQVNGPPPKVEPCKPGENASAKLSCARIAPSGSPPASGLATTTISGKSNVPLISKRAAGAAQAALNFVGDQRRAVMRGQFPRARPKRAAHREDAAFALNGLHDDGAHRIVEFRFQIGGIVKRTNSTPGTSGANGSRYFCG